MTDFLQDNGISAPWSGSALLAMFTAGARILETHVDLVNRLNVFPVQDGDTGINMLLTLRDTLTAAQSSDGDSAAAVAKAMSDGACMGAKGNSGLIVSQLFKGVSAAFEGKASVSAADFANALTLAREYAYGAIGNPVEGTMLTVFTHAAEAAALSAQEGAAANDMLTAAADAAKNAVALTPTLLPRLQEAGVVDSGGLGLWMILEGARRCAAGDSAHASDLDMPLPEGVDIADAAVSLDFLDMTEEEEYGNCTQFVIQGEGLDINAVRAEMSARGESAVVIGDDALMKVHVHTETPDALLDYARSLGEVSRVSVENMDDQRERLAYNQRQQEGMLPMQIIPKPILAVAWGSGLEDLFHREGAAIMVAGDTMNPSVREIVDAIDKVPSEYVIVLPNNKNIIPAAQQAAEVSDKTALVVPTADIPQGIAAILEFLPYRSIADNAAEMEQRMEWVRTAEITRSARTVTLDGVEAMEGQLIGMLDRQLVAAGDGLADTLLAVLRRADMDDAEIVTLYGGDPLTDEEAEHAIAQAQAEFPDIEFEYYYGGQPYYHFIVSIE